VLVNVDNLLTNTSGLNTRSFYIINTTLFALTPTELHALLA
jgi:hypothetical protein